MTQRRLVMVLILGLVGGLVPASPGGATFEGDNGDLFAIESRLDGSNVVRFNADGGAGGSAGDEPVVNSTIAVSPDGKTLAYAKLGEDGDEDIYLRDLDTMQESPLLDNEVSDVDPAFSPDGSRIAFASQDASGDYELTVMEVGSQSPTAITDNDGDDRSPSWGGVGDEGDTLIAFQSDADGDEDIYTVLADGSEMTKLTNNAVPDVSPNWAPDGNNIAYASEIDDVLQIHTMRFDGTEVTQVTETDGESSDPAFSPDGTRIAFSFQEAAIGTLVQLYVMNADGGNPARVEGTQETSEYFGAEWTCAGDSCLPDQGPGTVEIPRTISLQLRRHVVARGEVASEHDEGARCIEGQPVVVQRKRDGRFRKVGDAMTGSDGSWRVKLKDRKGRYRAVIRSSAVMDGETTYECEAARSPKRRHVHPPNVCCGPPPRSAAYRR